MRFPMVLKSLTSYNRKNLKLEYLAGQFDKKDESHHKPVMMQK